MCSCRLWRKSITSDYYYLYYWQFVYSKQSHQNQHHAGHSHRLYHRSVQLLLEWLQFLILLLWLLSSQSEHSVEARDSLLLLDGFLVDLVEFSCQQQYLRFDILEERTGCCYFIDWGVVDFEMFEHGDDADVYELVLVFRQRFLSQFQYVGFKMVQSIQKIVLVELLIFIEVLRA